MENQNLNEVEILEIKKCAERIEELASLKDAQFSFDMEEDKFIKEHVKSYMMWFKGVAWKIEEILKGIEENVEE